MKYKPRLKTNIYSIIEYMDRISLIQAFIKVVDTGSFSSAATLQGSSQSHVSKMIRALESDLNVTLFTRTTRKLSLTEDAKRFLPHARMVVERFQEAREAVYGDKAEPRGKIRLLTSDGLGRFLFMPYLKSFLTRYPHLSIEHMVNDRKLDLVENNIDIALRMGDLKDSAYRSRKIGLARRITVASQGYLESNGTPKVPEDLLHHNCILFTRLSEYTGSSNAWEYRDPKANKVSAIETSGTYATDNSSIVLDAVLDGVGIYQGPNWVFREHIKNGALKVILAEFEMEPFPIYVLHPSVEYLPTRIRTLIDFLTDEFKLNPWVAF